MRRFRRATDAPTPDVTRRRLSAREREVALLVGDGLTDAAIASHLGLAVTTISLYIRHIRLRLRLKNRGELEAWVAARRLPADDSPDLRRLEIDEPSR